MSRVPLEKVFYAEIFLQRFNVSTHKKTQIKKYIVSIFNELEMFGIIDKNYRLVRTNKTN